MTSTHNSLSIGSIAPACWLRISLLFYLWCGCQSCPIQALPFSEQAQHYAPKMFHGSLVCAAAFGLTDSSSTDMMLRPHRNSPRCFRSEGPPTLLHSRVEDPPLLFSVWDARWKGLLLGKCICGLRGRLCKRQLLIPLANDAFWSFELPKKVRQGRRWWLCEGFCEEYLTASESRFV